MPGFAHRRGSPVLWPPILGRTNRIGLGTANSAGQLASFAQAICRARPDTGAEVVMTLASAHLRYPADVYIEPKAKADPAFQRWAVGRAAVHYTHMIADAFQPVLGWLNGRDVGADLPMLRKMRVPVALLGHGSEVRQPLRHMDRHKYSLYRQAHEDKLRSLIQIAERNRRIAEACGVPVFVTTPDLLDDLPNAIWTPVVVDVDAWYCDESVMERQVPVVVHAPSRRWTKGTGAILPVLEDLHARGAIEFRLLEEVHHDRMRELIQSADIVVDQLAVGSYGVLACEGMAAGKPVIAYIGETSAEHYGPVLPVVNANPKSFREVLESLLDDRERTRRIGRDSLRYVREIHDGRLTVERLGAFLDL